MSICKNAENSVLSSVLTKAKEIASKENLRKFFMGKWYPVWIFVSVFLSHALGIEFYLTMLDLLLLSVALFVCDSIRPVLPVLITFLYRIARAHSPGDYTGSSFIFEGILPKLFLAVFGVFLISLVLFAVRNRMFKGFGIKNTPMLIPLAMLSVSFLTAGAFYDGWCINDLGFGALQAVCFAVVFYILYYGLKNEDADELCDYFVYIAALTALLLACQVALLYLTSDIVVSDGRIHKDHVQFGWGISNTCGSAISVLMPVCVLGAIRSKSWHSYLYFAVSVIAMIATYFTLSRSSILAGSILYAVSLIICCFKGERRNKYKIIIVSLVICSVVGMIIFKDEIDVLFASAVDKGFFNNNGRFELYKRAWENFKAHPIFGIGYFSFSGFSAITRPNFVPALAHNTVMEILSAMGIVGILSYAVYRVFSLIPFLTKPTTEKMLLFISCAILVGESLLDNFLLWFAPTFSYNIMIVLAFMLLDKQKRAELGEDGSLAEPHLE